MIYNDISSCLIPIVGGILQLKTEEISYRVNNEIKIHFQIFSCGVQSAVAIGYILSSKDMQILSLKPL